MEKRIYQVDVESLLFQAANHPDPDIRDQLIDLEVSPYGVWIGFSAANKVWHDVIPDENERIRTQGQ